MQQVPGDAGGGDVKTRSWPRGRRDEPQWTTEDLLNCLPPWGYRQRGKTVSNLADELGEDNVGVVRERLNWLIGQRRVVERWMGGDPPLHWRK